MSTSPQSSSNGSSHPIEVRRPADVVLGFLTALADDDVEAALALVADDIVYENVSLPTIRGKRRFEKGARSFYDRRLRFDVRIHKIAADGDSVLTERTDALMLGGYRAQFWVCGAFEVRDGQITLWRDYFDWRDVILGSLRGMIGILVPSLRASFED